VCSLWQRINVMQSLRALAGDAYILYFLFTTYDLKQARKCYVFILSLHAYNMLYAMSTGSMRMRPRWTQNVLQSTNGPCRRH